MREGGLPSWLKADELVVAQIGRFPAWPGYVGECAESGGWKRRNSDGDFEVWVMFLNSYEGDWVPISQVAKFGTREAKELCEYEGHGLTFQDRLDHIGAFDEAEDRVKNRLPRGRAGECVREGDLVLARFDSYPPWPAVIERTDNSYPKMERNMWLKRRGAGKEPVMHCKFLGEVKHNWVPESRICLYTRERCKQTTVRKNNILYSEYQAAVDEADQTIGGGGKPSRIDGNSSSSSHTNDFQLLKARLE